MTAISYTVHYRLPEDGKQRYDLWVKTENGWQKQDSTVDGSYLLFTSDRRNRHLLCAGADRQSSAVGLAGSSDPFGSNAGGDPDPQKAGPPNHTEPPAEGPSEKIVNIISKKKPDCAARSPVFLVSLS